MANKKVTISVQEEALKKIDDFANARGLSRSGALTSLALEALDQKTFMASMPDLVRLAANQTEQKR